MNRTSFVAAVSAMFAAISAGFTGPGYAAGEHTPAVLLGGGEVPLWAQGLVDKLHVAFNSGVVKYNLEQHPSHCVTFHGLSGDPGGGWVVKWAERREWMDQEMSKTWVLYEARLCGPVPRYALKFDIELDRSFFQMVVQDEGSGKPIEGSCWMFPYTSYAACCLIEHEPQMIAAMQSGAAWQLRGEGAPTAPWIPLG